jgi:hypothetical protein
MANTIKKRQDIETQIIVRALKDESFKQQLLSNPDVAKAEIEKVLGQKVPDGFKVQVLQEAENQAYLVIPAIPISTPGLSDQQLEAVASGSGFGFDKMTIQLEGVPPFVGCTGSGLCN